jgi:DNA-binding MarR family transcriptional regulator
VDHAEVLTPSQSSVLNRLHRDGPAIQADLAAVEQVRQQSMAATLAALVELGYVERAPDPADRRRTLITLSALGERTARGVAEHRDEWLADSLAGEFTDAERRTLAEALPLLQRLAQL